MVLRGGFRTLRASHAVHICSRNYHKPVMLLECLSWLRVEEGGVYIDCTLGGGGHSLSILEAGGRVIGLDQDEDAVLHASKTCSKFLKSGKMEIFHANFRKIDSIILKSKLFAERNGLKHGRVTQDALVAGSCGVDGVLMDLGVSSHQIDQARRGFAFSQEGPIDMRMRQRGGGESCDLLPRSQELRDFVSTPYAVQGISGEDIVNKWSASEIADALYNFGDERNSRAIARQICLARPFESTVQLADVISAITPWKRRTATLARCFQALRIVVNDEMNALDEALASMRKCIRTGGRLVVLSYHSLEDRRVKGTMKSENWQPLMKKALRPSVEEVQSNSRARSAKMRAATAL